MILKQIKISKHYQQAPLDASPLDGPFTPLEAGLEKAMLTLTFSFGFPSLLSMSETAISQISYFIDQKHVFLKEQKFLIKI